MVTSGAVTAVGASVADLSLVPESPVSATVAEFVTDGNAADATETVSVSVLLAPTAIGPAFVQVTICAFCAPALQVQLAGAPETKLRPAGSVSVTVICCCVAAVPLLVSLIA
jgi:hypothetical protein